MGTFSSKNLLVRSRSLQGSIWPNQREIPRGVCHKRFSVKENRQKSPKKRFLKRGSSALKISCGRGSGDSRAMNLDQEVSSIIYQGEEDQRMASEHVLRPNPDETLIDPLSLLNTSKEAKSVQNDSPEARRGLGTSPNILIRRKKRQLLISPKNRKKLLKSRISELLNSPPNFRIKTEPQPPLNLLLKTPTEEKRGFFRKPKNYPKCPKKGLLFLTRIRKKSKTIINKSPTKRKPVFGFFEENLAKSKNQFLPLSKNIEEDSSDEEDCVRHEEDLSTSKIQILQDEDYLTNQRQNQPRRR